MFQLIYDQLSLLNRKFNNSFKAIGYEKLTITSTAQSLQSVPSNAKYALIECESTATGIAIRYLELGDKTPPTATNGIGRSNLDAFDIADFANINNFRVILAQAGTTTLHIQYYT